MIKDKSPNGIYTDRLSELQQRFQKLEPEIRDIGTKQGLSLIYAMLQETWRKMGNIQGSDRDDLIKDIANLYRSAPKMQGVAMNAPLSEGIPAPDFALKDALDNTVKLSDYTGSTVLLVFYPLDWSPGCSQQLDLYQSEINEFERRDVKLIGISVDSIYSHGAWITVRSLGFPLLSDFNPHGDVAKKYNVYRETDGFSERALYIVDKKGIIRYSYVSPYLHHVPDINDLFNKLDEINKKVITV